MKEYKYLDSEFANDFLSVPTFSSHEIRIIEFIEKWAVENGINIYADKKHNLYLTKGVLGENEYYPCFTAHMDSVQEAHLPFIENNEPLPLVYGKVNDKLSVTCEGFGPGGDDKCGLLIILTLFKHLPTMKAAFFVEEEIGCLGSNELDESFFSNVGYVIGYDSPGAGERAAHTCGGSRLFSRNFYETHMKPICDEFGYTKFFSEPWTDIINICNNTEVECMNFGSGYYNAHSNYEYIILEDVDNAIALGVALATQLGNNKFVFSADCIKETSFMNTLSGVESKCKKTKKSKLKETDLEKETRILEIVYKNRISNMIEYITNVCVENDMDAYTLFPELFVNEELSKF